MDKEDHVIWLERAKSNLEIAVKGKVEGVFLEDLCFEIQQSAEKSLKALLIYFQDDYPKVHSFNFLLERLEKYVRIPNDIKDVLELSDYAVQTRYPGEYYPVSEEEYKRAISIAERVLDWVKAQTEK